MKFGMNYKLLCSILLLNTMVCAHIYGAANITIQRSLSHTELEFLNAAINGEKEKVESLISKGIDIDVAGQHGITALMNAARYGHKEIVEVLIKFGVNVNASNQFNSTALIEAVAYKNIHGKRKDIVELLINAGANINAGINTVDTPLIHATMNGYTEVVQILIEKKANLEVKDENMKYTALARASNSGHKDIAQLLINAGADIHTLDIDKNTPLMLAAFHGHTDVVKLLIDSGANINAVNVWGSSALILAVKRNWKEIVKLLLNEKTDLSITEKGRNAIGYAINNKHIEIVALIKAESLARVAKKRREVIKNSTNILPILFPLIEEYLQIDDFEEVSIQYDLSSTQVPIESWLD